MILAPKPHCSGCSACYDACPKNAIAMIADEEGFLYPQIDEAKCVNCGLCRKVCPTINRGDSRRPLAVYAAKARDTELRLASSSGGVFSLLARQILAKGGKVYGAAFDKRDWSVEHIGVSDEDGLSDLRGSKYVQSRIAGIYREVKAALESNLPVLFSGTPCQIAALRAFLNSPTPTSHSNLILVDVACHAVSSPLVWQKYLDWQCETALAQGRGSAPAEGRNIRRISFRRKNCGWKRYSLSLRFANDKEYLSVFSEDAYMLAFLNELINRPSCYNCRCKELRSGSDLTIADFWGIEEVRPEFFDDAGVSLVLVNTPKGEGLIDELRDVTEFEQVAYDDLVKRNAIVSCVKPNPLRVRFLNRVTSANFVALALKLTRPAWRVRLRSFLGRILRKIGLRK